MILHPTTIAQVIVIEAERHVDERGHFARTYDAALLADHGLDPTIVQCSTSFNHRAGTLRGLHFQASPHGESKLVRCTRGAIYDVAVDLRPDSGTHLRWYGVELSADNGRALFIPPGCAHGFQTLQDASEVLYQISVAYEPGAARGVRWDDPAFGIDWPAPPPHGRIMSTRDAGYPDYIR
ncbi:MAG TPA: dTDP-4-dehydrorhamnose 3,5-epimerase [Solirubrobacteraceae bacterium]|jgi:dTDP-4-dehydrorhamnose 3,5-epimerase|nr:dTDP-4-dehydrorhamnose 3,5-epimerase [Solirubrobacteraceae bacterium]